MLVADLEYMARTIYGEARGKSFRGKVAVAHVIINRWKQDWRRHTTLAGVCTDPLQFSAWNPSDPNRKIIETVDLIEPVFLECCRAAVIALDPATPDETEGSTHYHTAAQPGWARTWPPAWAVGHDPVIEIDGHLFYNDVR